MPEISLPPAGDAQALTALVLPLVTAFMSEIAKLPPEQRQRRISKVLDALAGR